MVVLLIGIAVSAVWMGAMLPAWRQQTVRQKEADLIFRGEEYARAIALYWRKNNQTLPTNFDQLVSQRYLRKKYLDPMTNKEFLAVGGVGPGSTAPGAGGRGQGPGSGPIGPAQLGARAGISGVRSTSTATSIVVYRGQTSYSQFPFDYIMALQRMGTTGQPQLGGAAGRGRGGDGRGRAGGAVRIDETVGAPPGPGRVGRPGAGPARGVGGGRGLPTAPGRGP